MDPCCLFESTNPHLAIRNKEEVKPIFEINED